MTVLLLELFGLAAVVVVAGMWLARCTDAISEKTGIGRTLGGMVLLALATSLPELSITCSAARMGSIDLAVGDLYGASLFNLLILGLLDLTHYSRGRMLSRMAAAHALSAVMCILLFAFSVLFLIWRPSWTILGVGPGGLVLAATYAIGLRLVYFDQRLATAVVKAAANDEPAPQVEPPAAGMSLRIAIVGYLAAAAAIFVVAPFLAHAADELADRTGLGGTFIGTLLVGLVTSLPETVSTLTAVRMGAYDLAVGNVFGSNSFNMTILLPIDFFYDGNLFASASPTHALTGLAAIVVTAVVILGLLYQSERRFWLIEPDASLVVLLVLAAMTLVYFAR